MVEQISDFKNLDLRKVLVMGGYVLFNNQSFYSCDDLGCVPLSAQWDAL